jgi:hypothetical protein
MTARYRLTVIHCVPDYEQWRAVIRDSPKVDIPGRLRRTVFRSVDDPNEVMVEIELESADAAQQFLTSVDLRELLDRTGVEVYPPVFIGERVDELSE